MNQTNISNFDSNRSEQLEDGEIVDDNNQQLYPSLNVTTNTQVNEVQNPIQSLYQQNPFLQQQKIQNFNPNHFAQVTNVRFKGKNSKTLKYFSNVPDTQMEQINEGTQEFSNDETSLNQNNNLNSGQNLNIQEQYSDKEDSQNEDLEQTQISNIINQSNFKQNHSLENINQFQQSFEQSSRKGTSTKRNYQNYEEEKKIAPNQNAQVIYTELPRFNPNSKEELRKQRRQEVYEHERLKIAVQDFSRLMKSKQEIYSILLTQGQYYLPPYQECTIEFLRETFYGSKKLLFTHEVKMINVPKLNELAVKNLLDSVKNDPVINKYLPDLSQKNSINRQYLYNVINTLKPEFFPDNIKAGLQQRKDLKSFGQQKYIEIQSDMYDLLSTAVNLNPSQRGRAVHLLNVGAKKRKYPERGENRFQTPKYQLSQYLAPSAHQYAIEQTTKGDKRKRTNDGQVNYSNLSTKSQHQSLNMSMIQPQYTQ